MHDKKLTVIDIPDAILMFLYRYGLQADDFRITRLLDNLISLTSKLMYNFNDGVTEQEILELIMHSEINIIDNRMLYDFKNALTLALPAILGDIVQNNILDTVKYVLGTNNHHIAIETYRI